MAPRRNSFCCKPPACVATRWGSASTGVWYPGWSQDFLNDAPMPRRPWLHRIQCVRASAVRALCCGMAAARRRTALRALRTAGRWTAGLCCCCGRLYRRHWAALVRLTVPHAAGHAVRLVRPGRRLRHATPHAANCIGTRRPPAGGMALGRTGMALGRTGMALGRTGMALGHAGTALGRTGMALGRAGMALCSASFCSRHLQRAT